MYCQQLIIALVAMMVDTAVAVVDNVTAGNVVDLGYAVYRGTLNVRLHGSKAYPR